MVFGVVICGLSIGVKLVDFVVFIWVLDVNGWLLLVSVVLRIVHGLELMLFDLHAKVLGFEHFLHFVFMGYLLISVWVDLSVF